MIEVLHPKSEILAGILGAIEGDLDNHDATDIRSFIAAGEYGLAADTLFSAIAAKNLRLDKTIVAQLAAVEDLYNTFGDLDPKVSEEVLRQDQKRTPLRM
ncbi:hypothetical protein [Methylobacterium sp. Leaf89]|uniref:hypothetical protein n=1 Tax=Methylobacterium sp. Leaf89 TaxID=1736245 RepID=UPI0006F37B3E|nr:hypothetical protein [Methylobacterium sp. Leaf89]KQO71965.1 hypothetical protein ASF18_20535 [Methylobacterium sp. Leaf89]